jgi:hypothetical protein
LVALLSDGGIQEMAVVLDLREILVVLGEVLPVVGHLFLAHVLEGLVVEEGLCMAYEDDVAFDLLHRVY